MIKFYDSSWKAHPVIQLDKFYLIPYCFSTGSSIAAFSNEENFKFDIVLKAYKLQSVEIN